MPRSKKEKRQRCRWSCAGEVPTVGGICPICGRNTPRRATTRDIRRVQVIDSDGEISLSRSVEIRKLSEFPDLESEIRVGSITEAGRLTKILGAYVVARQISASVAAVAATMLELDLAIIED